MKKLFTLIFYICFLSVVSFAQTSDDTQQVVKFLGIDDNYDYETIYYETEGKVCSLTSFDYSAIELNKGDKIAIKTSTERIEIPGDQSFQDVEVVNEISLIEKGILSRFLETTPSIEYQISGSFGSYTDLVKRELNLYLAASNDSAVRDLFERKDGGVVVLLVLRFVPERDGIIEDIEEHEMAVYCNISYEVGGKEEVIKRFAMIPDYGKSRYYGITQFDRIYPVALEY